MSAIAIIPARGGSKGIPKKNLAELCGKPLVVHTIEQARRSDHFGVRVFVSTDDSEIADIARDAGAWVVWRPEELCNDQSPSEWALQHVIDFHGLETHFIVMLQCTSPIRQDHDIDSALQLIAHTRADSLLSVSPFHNFIWGNPTDPTSINYNYRNRPMRQEMPQNFIENGSIYIMTPKILKRGNRLGGKIVMYEMDKWAGIDINTQEDLEMAEWVMKRRAL